jgi:Ca2+-binding EF-hand superfamily protein
VLNRPKFEEAMALNANIYGEGERSAAKRQMFRSPDADGDGAISLAEARRRPELAQAFARADRNSDGYLTGEELLSGGPPPGGGRKASTAASITIFFGSLLGCAL